jgi:hypothetical protein
MKDAIRARQLGLALQQSPNSSPGKDAHDHIPSGAVAATRHAEPPRRSPRVTAKAPVAGTAVAEIRWTGVF